MKAIIEGKRYNTDTATEIGSASSREGRSDFHWWEAGLYVTKNGRYFLAGKGHAASRFRDYDGNMYGPGKRIFVMDKAEALDWAEEHLSPDTIEEHFSDVVQDA